MALPPLVRIADLSALSGAPIANDDPRAGAVLARVSALVRSYTGQTWVDENDDLADVPDDVQSVVLAVAERVWRNPAGAIQITKGPFTTRLAEAAGEGLYLTETEKSILGKWRTSGAGGLWTM